MHIKLLFIGALDTAITNLSSKKKKKKERKKEGKKKIKEKKVSRISIIPPSRVSLVTTKESKGHVRESDDKEERR
jgi:hypothetical protein